MSFRISSSLKKSIKKKRLRLPKNWRLGCSDLRWVRNPRRLIVALTLLVLITALIPRVSWAPLCLATRIGQASSDTMRVTRLEAEVKRIFDRFRMPVDQALVHEMTIVGLFNRVDPRLIAAIVSTESSGDPLAVSNRNAIGLMQINAKVWARKLDFAQNNPFDPGTNLRLGVPILQSCLKDYHWLDSALAAYIGDPGFTQEETGAYVNRVIRIFEKAANLKVPRNPKRRDILEQTAASSVSVVVRHGESPIPAKTLVQ